MERDQTSFNCYRDITTQQQQQQIIQTGYHHESTSSTNPTAAEILINLSTTGMDMMGFSNGTTSHGHDAPSSSKLPIDEPATTTSTSHLEFYDIQQQQIQHEQNMLLVDDSALTCAVFPCEGNERPSQGLSLSLSSTNPSSIGLQSFELRHTATTATNISTTSHEEMRFMDSTSTDFLGKNPLNLQQQQILQDGFLSKSQILNPYHQFGPYQVRNSSFLTPTQELLNEFCSLGTKASTTDIGVNNTLKNKSHKAKQWGIDGGGVGTGGDSNGSTSGGVASSVNKSLYSLDFLELQKRKRKLLSLLEEVDRRYKHYCYQMKAVVSSFESMAGSGAASVYSALASKAMSRHFRCLKDGIVAQIHATRKAMGEKDPAAPGTTKGETPKLKIIDLTLRQQRAFQQMSLMENHPWRPQRGLPERSVSVLRAWLFEHFLHPYPSDVDKHILARQTGLSRSQVSNWFINARVRLWKPMIEDMYLEETKDHDQDIHNMATSDGNIPDLLENNTINIVRQSNDINHNYIRNNLMNITSSTMLVDHKPTQEQLVRIDSECLSSIITNPSDRKNDSSFKNPKPYPNPTTTHHLQQYGGYGAMGFDFSSYNHPNTAGSGGVSYGNNPNTFNGTTNGGSVSLTLGLQQHGGHANNGNGHLTLAFSPSTQNSLFYSRDHIEDCQQVQYSLLDGDQGQNLPYRNLMGAQLLHDLAG